MSLKLTGLISRRPDLTVQEFSQHWRTIHRALALRLVPTGIMRGYVQNHRTPQVIEGIPAPADGAAELWVPSVEEVQRLGTCPEYLEGAWLDERNFMDGRARSVITTESTAGDEPAREHVLSCVKVMLFTKRRPGLTCDQFRAAVSDRGMTLWGDVRPNRQSYELAIDIPPQMGAQAYDLVASSWWPDHDTFRTAWARVDRRHAAEFIDLEALEGMFVREEPVFWPS